MNLTKDRTQITYILILSKFMVIATVFFHFLQHKFNFEQTKELLFIILPLFTVYFTIMFKFLSTSTFSDVETNQKLKRGPIVLIGKWIPIIFALYMIIVLTFQSAGTANSMTPFLQMKEMIGWGESIFGIYIGYIIQSIFKVSNTKGDQNYEIVSALKELQNSIHQQMKTSLSIPSLDTANLKKLIAENKIQEAIRKLSDLIKLQVNSKHLLNQVINLSAQYHQYQERKRLNLTDDDIIANQIVKGLLEVIDELENL